MASYVLGVARTHDVAAALFKDGELTAVAEAERVLDEKHARGPEKLGPALHALLKQAAIGPDDIAAVCIADSGRERLELHFPDSVADVHSPHALHRLGTIADSAKLPLGGLASLGFRPDAELSYVCHHAAHALGAAYLSGYERCAVLVVDGYGVCCGTMAYSFEHGRLIRLESYRDVALMGWRYQLFGHFIQEISSEKTDVLDLAGKVMGLNAYGRPREPWVERLAAWFRGDYADYARCWDAERVFFADLFPLRRNSASVLDPEFRDFVASMQEAYARVLEHVARRLLEETGATKLVLSGGCALNVLANSRLSRLCEGLFIQPDAGDSGLPVGAAYAASRRDATPSRRPASPFLGLALLDAGDIEAAIPATLSKAWLPEGDPVLAPSLARALAADGIVGLIRGRSEIGPRALGNRSLLANAGNPDMRAVLNDKIKHREWWRPFAPVCRSVDMAEYFDCDCPSAFMLTTATVKPGFARALSSACHEDGTARLQVLPERAWHPLLWDVLEALKAETGIGVLINTSYNEGGKPLVNRAAAAISMFMAKPIDALWCEGWLLSKDGGGG